MRGRLHRWRVVDGVARTHTRPASAHVRGDDAVYVNVDRRLNASVQK
jgi:hypothetical protein